MSASKTTLNHYNLKILRPKVTKNITNLPKKFCKYRPRAPVSKWFCFQGPSKVSPLLSPSPIKVIGQVEASTHSSVKNKPLNPDLLQGFKSQSCVPLFDKQ